MKQTREEKVLEIIEKGEISYSHTDGNTIVFQAKQHSKTVDNPYLIQGKISEKDIIEWYCPCRAWEYSDNGCKHTDSADIMLKRDESIRKVYKII